MLSLALWVSFLVGIGVLYLTSMRHHHISHMLSWLVAKVFVVPPLAPVFTRFAPYARVRVGQAAPPRAVRYRGSGRVSKSYQWNGQVTVPRLDRKSVV